MISPRIFSANNRAISDFPTAVGPAIAMRFTLGSDFRARQDKEEGGSRQQNADADQMGGRGPAAQIMLGIVAAKHLDKRACARIANEVGGEDLAIEFLAPIQPCQKQI